MFSGVHLEMGDTVDDEWQANIWHIGQGKQKRTVALESGRPG